MKFVLEIELGNDAMRTGDDIAIELRRVATGLPSHSLETRFVQGTIRDTNGNNVGYWRTTDDA